MKYKRFLKSAFSIFFAFLFLLNSFSVAVSAIEPEHRGYVEYHTEASINFMEVIQVTLTDKATGDYFVHELYRINDYTGNLVVPIGDYSISTRVISETEDDNSCYFVRSLVSEISVQTDRIAVPVNLIVDMMTEVEVLPEEDFDSLNDVVSEKNDSVLDTAIVDEGTNSKDVTSNINENDEGKQTINENNGSLLFSTIFYGVLILAAFSLYLLFKYKFK